jgi:hypothetical protein
MYLCCIIHCCKPVSYVAVATHIRHIVLQPAHRHPPTNDCCNASIVCRHPSLSTVAMHNHCNVRIWIPAIHMPPYAQLLLQCTSAASHCNQCTTIRLPLTVATQVYCRHCACRHPPTNDCCNASIVCHHPSLSTVAMHTTATSEYGFPPSTCCHMPTTVATHICCIVLQPTRHHPPTTDCCNQVYCTTICHCNPHATIRLPLTVATQVYCTIRCITLQPTHCHLPSCNASILYHHPSLQPTRHNTILCSVATHTPRAVQI